MTIRGIEQVMSKKTVVIENQFICSEVVFDELIKRNKVKKWQPRNKRYLFHIIKEYGPNLWQGGWGQEKIYYNMDTGGPVIVKTSRARAKQLSDWCFKNSAPPDDADKYNIKEPVIMKLIERTEKKKKKAEVWLNTATKKFYLKCYEGDKQIKQEIISDEEKARAEATAFVTPTEEITAELKPAKQE